MTSIVDNSQLRLTKNNYSFIRPLLACQTYESMEYAEFKYLEKKIEADIVQSKKAEQIDFASVYFRDLTTGRWVGVNEDNTYSPASLLKVPVMIAYLKQSEANPKLLQKKFFYQDTNPLNVKPLINDPLLKNGNTYTAEQLIRGMIIDSDNYAKDLLESAIDPVILKDTYHDLGIISPMDDGQSGYYRISTKTYALFLRVLYNGTYLTKDNSEMALKWLAESKFMKGLRAGIPADIPIAHKYGARLVADEQWATKHIELNDCGIIYYINEPYLLCVMTGGQDPEKLASFIAQTAAIVQKSVAEQYK